MKKWLGNLFEFVAVAAYIAWTLYCRFTESGKVIDDLVFIVVMLVCIIIYILGVAVSRKRRKD